jgi:hypothetical protein
MGLFLFCKEKEYCIQYANWNAFRLEIIKATIEYAKSQEMKDNHDNYNYNDKDTNDDKYYKNLMQKLIDCESPSIEIDWEYNNFFIHYGIAGLFALCKKSDSTGYYSVGNSYDICELLSNIEPFMKKDEENPNRFMAIYEIFQESINTKTRVTLC